MESHHEFQTSLPTTSMGLKTKRGKQLAKARAAMVDKAKRVPSSAPGPKTAPAGAFTTPAKCESENSFPPQATTKKRRCAKDFLVLQSISTNCQDLGRGIRRQNHGISQVESLTACACAETETPKRKRSKSKRRCRAALRAACWRRRLQPMGGTTAAIKRTEPM